MRKSNHSDFCARVQRIYITGDRSRCDAIWVPTTTSAPLFAAYISSKHPWKLMRFLPTHPDCYTHFGLSLSLIINTKVLFPFSRVYFPLSLSLAIWLSISFVRSRDMYVFSRLACPACVRVGLRACVWAGSNNMTPHYLITIMHIHTLKTMSCVLLYLYIGDKKRGKRIGGQGVRVALSHLTPSIPGGILPSILFLSIFTPYSLSHVVYIEW